MRETRYAVDKRGGCFVCHDTTAHWHGPNTQAVVARHHDATGHQTWCDVYISYVYGHDPPSKESDEHSP